MRLQPVSELIRFLYSEAQTLLLCLRYHLKKIISQKTFLSGLQQLSKLSKEQIGLSAVNRWLIM